MKKIIMTVVAVLLVTSLLSIFMLSAYAVGGTKEEPLSANVDNSARAGYRTGSFILGNTDHEYIATLAASTSEGAYSVVTVLDTTVVGRRHENLNVLFRTSDSGNQPGVGGYCNPSCSGRSESVRVTYAGGMDKVIGYVSLRGNIIIFGDTNHSISLSA